MASKIHGKAGKLNIEIEQGSTFTLPLTWKDSNGDVIDISGWSARMHIRDEITSVTTILELTTGNGRITIDGPNGGVNLLIDDTDTAALDFTSGVYDLEMISPTTAVTRLLEGRVSLDKEVTR